MNTKKYISLIVALAAFGSLVLAAPAFAQTNQGGNNNGRFGGGANGRGMPNVVGTVSAINGNIITVNGRQGFKSAPATTFSVDATNAKIIKNNTAGAISSIAVGDTVMVQGTVSGTNVAAKTIRDGVAPKGQPIIQGNGQPVVAGKVTGVTGNTIAITNSSNVSYSVDATNAKFVVAGVSAPTISNVSVGDNVIVQGAVNGNSVVASSVIDQKAKANAGAGNTAGDKKSKPGFMGSIANFFKRLFGF